MRWRSSRAIAAAAALVAALALASPAAAKSYTADRFDVVVRVAPDGTLDVTETVVFHFESGTFREVFREIPLRRTDGIEVVAASMQGQPLPFGTERGTVEVRPRRNRVRVIWRFSPVEAARREFVLHYRVSGAVRRDEAGDVLAWRALPGQHHYRIETSIVRFELPAAPLEPPSVGARRVGAHDTRLDGGVLVVTSSAIRRNGWIEAAFRFPQASLAAAAPLWQQRAAAADALSGRWLLAAAGIVGAGLLLLAGWRQAYDHPPGDAEGYRREAQQPLPPDTLPPPLTGVLASNGQPGIEHAMAALFSLAERGEIEIAEKPRRLGQRDFWVTRRGSAEPAAGHERAALDTAFRSQDRPGQPITLSQARSRLTMRFRRFAEAARQDLIAAGLLDPARQAVRDRYHRAAAVILILAGVAVAPAVFLTREYGPWPMALPGALAVVGILSLIFGAAITPLSNDGVRRRSRWRAYKKHLTDVAQGREPSPGLPIHAVLPFAVALGLAGAWSKYLKQHAHPAPAWFHALPGAKADAAFPAFVAVGGASSSGGGGAGGGGGAAGGGASGAG